MEEVFKQAPEGISYEEVEKIFNDNNKDVLKTLIELWKIPRENIKNISEESSKWTDIRNTCDDFDKEMKKVLDVAKNNK